MVGRRSIYSASWDCTVRIWNRETLRRESLLAFPDWVHCAKPRGGHLLVRPSPLSHQPVSSALKQLRSA